MSLLCGPRRPAGLAQGECLSSCPSGEGDKVPRVGASPFQESALQLRTHFHVHPLI